MIAQERGGKVVEVVSRESQEGRDGACAAAEVCDLQRGRTPVSVGDGRKCGKPRRTERTFSLRRSSTHAVLLANQSGGKNEGFEATAPFRCDVSEDRACASSGIIAAIARGREGTMKWGRRRGWYGVRAAKGSLKLARFVDRVERNK